MRILKTRSDLIRAHLGDKRTVGAERFSTIESHQFQLAPITKIVPLGPVSQWDDSSQMGPIDKRPHYPRRPCHHPSDENHLVATPRNTE